MTRTLRPKEKRQFRVTDVATGLHTYVTIQHNPAAPNGHRNAVIQAGYMSRDYYARTVMVSLVRPERERPLPFDSLPLVIRRGHKREAAL